MTSKGFRRCGCMWLLQGVALWLRCGPAAQCLAYASDITLAAPELVSNLVVALTFITQPADFGSITVPLTLDFGTPANATLRPGTFPGQP